MPSWTATAIEAADRSVDLSSASLTVQSDAISWDHFSRARSARAVVDVEHLDPGSELRFYRYGGASATAHRLLDTTGAALTLSASTQPLSTVAVIDWNEPLPASGRMEVVFQRTGASPVTSTFQVLLCFLLD